MLSIFNRSSEQKIPSEEETIVRLTREKLELLGYVKELESMQDRLFSLLQSYTDQRKKNCPYGNCSDCYHGKRCISGGRLYNICTKDFQP
jgi:hypothetical protein